MTWQEEAWRRYQTDLAKQIRTAMKIATDLILTGEGMNYDQTSDGPFRTGGHVGNIPIPGYNDDVIAKRIDQRVKDYLDRKALDRIHDYTLDPGVFEAADLIEAGRNAVKEREYRRPIDHLVVNNTHRLNGDEITDQIHYDIATGELTVTFINVENLEVRYKQ